MSIFEN